MGILFMLTFWVYHAPWYLGELMVRTGRIQHRISAGSASDAWLVEPLRQSMWMAIGLQFHFVVLEQLLTLAVRLYVQ